ncbi:ABC transporter substrate-binding protein [Amnibacterium kyonggiense]
MSITRRGVLGAAAVAAALTLGLAGCASSSTIGGSGASSSAAASGGATTSGDAKSIVVGSANFGENEILGYIYGGALADKGYTVSYKPAIGARAAYLAALKSGEINFVPEYAGSLLSYLDQTANAKSGDAVKSGIDQKISTLNAKALDLAQAADSDSLNVTSSFAKQKGLTSIADLSKAGAVTLAANPEFATRPDGIKGLESVYGLKDIKFKAINDGGGPTTLKALLSGQVQVADIYSTTPSIKQNKLVTLTDPKNLFASQQVVPIVSTSKATSDLESIVNGVSAKLTTNDLLDLNTQAAGSAKPDYQALAKAWLSKNGF